MPTKAGILREETFTEEGMEVDRRVFYTLTVNERRQAHRNSQAIAQLVKLLRERGIVTDTEIDDLLFACIT